MWTFIQDQILGMKWLSTLIGNLLTALGIYKVSSIFVQKILYNNVQLL